MREHLGCARPGAVTSDPCPTRGRIDRGCGRGRAHPATGPRERVEWERATPGTHVRRLPQGAAYDRGHPRERRGKPPPGQKARLPARVRAPSEHPRPLRVGRGARWAVHEVRLARVETRGWTAGCPAPQGDGACLSAKQLETGRRRASQRQPPGLAEPPRESTAREPGAGGNTPSPGPRVPEGQANPEQGRRT